MARNDAASTSSAVERPNSATSSPASAEPPTDEPQSFPPDEGPQAQLAPQPSADAIDEPPARSPDVATPKRRFARESESSADTAGDTSRPEGGERPARKSSNAVPIAGYESLSAAQVVARLPSLTQRQLAELERYEKRHESRRTVLNRIESLREREPWRGYDEEKVDQIRKKLADADDDRARRVRDYERRHRDRKGVMEAARRAVASA
jgi:hypothetical protein